MSITVITDSTAYIDKELAMKKSIRIVPLSVHFPDQSFLETEVDYDYFYKKIESTGIIPTSSQPSQGDLYTLFRDIILQGQEILGIFISSAMSGTFDTAISVKQHLLREYPQASIEIIDSRTNCMALGLQVLSAAEVVSNGGSMEDAVTAARYTREHVNFFFVPETLAYLKKGGRIGTASALLGSILNIRPILTVDMKKGMTHLFEKVRGTPAAIKRIQKLLEDDYNKYGLKDIVVHHINAPEKAHQLKAVLTDKYDIPISICTIGPVIGLHTGLGTVGVVYCTY